MISVFEFQISYFKHTNPKKEIKENKSYLHKQLYKYSEF